MVERVAIIGYSCRLPGNVSNGEDLYEMCTRKRSGWSEIPADRFSADAFFHPNPLKPGAFNPKGGYFLDHDIKKFDAPFFSITAAEAISMDPQQRLLMECTFEALENAGIPKEAWAGRNVSVYTGGNFSDYELQNVRDLETSPSHQATGSAPAMQSGRISHAFDFRGPSMTIDTACSGSLVALHHGFQSIIRGEATESIVAGSRLNILPDYFVTMSMSQLLNDHGKTHAFDERGDGGFARGEGCGVLVLKPLEAAIRDRDVIRAVICNSGVGQDGRTLGITNPNGDAQRDLIKKVYREAKLDPKLVGFVEMHGTGTKVGDPIEARAIHEALAQGRTPKDPLYIGSVKTNVGHLEGASGVISIIKAAMMLEKKFILPNHGFKTANPAIPLNDYNMKVLTNTKPWPRGKKYVSVSNYGFGGTNAHAVLEMAPANIPKAEDSTSSLDVPDAQKKLFVISANDKDSLDERIKGLGIYFEQRPEVFEKGLSASVAYTLGSRRSHLNHRIAISASSLDELGHKMTQAGLRGSRAVVQPKLGFVFTGQGAQWAEMGMGLMEDYPVFAAAILRADEYLHTLGADFSLLHQLQLPKKESRVDQPDVSQPACTAIQIGLVDLLRSWGIRPSSVVGHSSGEIAAAYAAGAYDADGAMALAYHRGNLTLKLKKAYPTLKGGMIAVGLGAEEVTPFLRKLQSGYATIACMNSPGSVTISGDRVAVDELHEILDQAGIFNRKLLIDVAYHSEHMARVSDLYLNSISDRKPMAALEAEFVSSVRGQSLDTTELGPSYWVENLVSPVRFVDALTEMCSGTVRPDLLIEIGPHSAMKGPIMDTFKKLNISGDKIAYSPSIVRNADAAESVLGAAGAAFMKGLSIDLNAINFAGSNASRCSMLTDMPKYPWQHKTSYWHEARIPRQHKSRSGKRNDILGIQAAYSNDLEPTWRNIVRLDDLSWLRHHKMQSMTVFPFAGYLAMAIEAAQQQAISQSMVFDGFELLEVIASSALILDDSADTEMTITLRPYSDASRGYSGTWKDFRICSWDVQRGWAEHCRGLVRPIDSERNKTQFSLATDNIGVDRLSTREAEVQSKANEPIQEEDMYSVLESVGAAFGTSFKGLRDCYSGDKHSRGSIEIQDTAAMMPKNYETDLVIRPSLLDAFLHLTWPILGAGRGRFETLYMPTTVRSATISTDMIKNPGERLDVWCTGSPDLVSPKPTTFNIHATRPGKTGQAVIKFEDFVMTPIRDSKLSSSDQSRKMCFKIISKPFKTGRSKSQDSAASTEQANRNGHTNGANGHLNESNGRNGTNGHGNGTNGHTNGTNGHTNGHADNTNGHANGTNGQNVENVTCDASDVILVEFGKTGKFTSEIIESIDKMAGMSPPAHSLGESIPDCSGKRVMILQSPKRSLRDVSLAEFDALKTVLLNASEVLWVHAKNVPESSMSIGLARTIRSENASKIRMLGLSTTEIESSWPTRSTSKALDAFWFSGDEEPIKDMEFTGYIGKLTVQRIIEDGSLNDFIATETGTPGLETQAYQQPNRRLKLEISSYGALDTLHFTDETPQPLHPDDVEIDVHATGVNFKDIVVSMGQVAQPYLGVECSGTISSVGANVSHLSVGQRVMAMTTGAYSTYARCRATSAHPIANDMSYESAATIPVVFCTAYYALFDLGRLTKGEKVLIHAAAGGVGQAAIMLAQMAGAEIFATVGSEAKKVFIMETYGIPEERIFRSRDASFGAGVRAATRENGGVDVVLNSLAGDLLRESMECLAPFGRFVEIGKADITRNSKLDMLKFEWNCTFASVDLTKVAAFKPAIMKRLLEDVDGLLKKGIIQTIAPIEVFGIAQTEDAFRKLQTGKALGKLVVMPKEGEMVMATKRRTGDDILHPDATYILIGGTGGLGRSMAKWMSNKGARNLVLTSRNASVTDKVQELMDSLAPSGTRIFVKACDVANKASVERLILEDLKGLPPVRGVIHGAMVLKDMLFEQMTLDDFQSVAACKVEGARNLHEVLSPQPLDFFVALSSVAGIVGNRGQAAYAAANVFLDSFMEWRRSQGLPGVAIDLAAVSNVGYLADGSEARRQEVLKNIGAQTVDESEVLGLLAAALTGKMNDACDGQCITGLGDATMESFWLHDAKFSVLRESLEADDAGSGQNTVAVSLLKIIRSEVSKEEAAKALYGALAAKIAAVLVLPPDSIEPAQTLKSLGLDSLVAIEIRNWVARETEVNLQVLELLSSGSIASLVELILRKMK